MPVHPVKKDGKTIGYEWGSRGKIYRGKGAKRRAAQQGAAAEKHGAREPGLSNEHAAKTLFGA